MTMMTTTLRRSSLLLRGMSTRQKQYPWSSLVKPFAFSVLFTGSAYTLAWTMEGSYDGPDAKIKVLAGLIAVNGAVFCGHAIPPYWRLSGIFFRTLSRYGTCDPRCVAQYPAQVLTSGFSHTEIWHLGLNMVGLYTIGSSMVDLLGSYQFLAFYGSAICWSSMAQVAMGITRARRGIPPRGSLGASGGIYALLGLVAWYAPNTSVYLIFLPFIPIQLGVAFTGMITMDAIGIARGWSTFGHAAHLTGGLTGLTYGIAHVPEAWIQKRREGIRKYINTWGR